MEAPETLKVLLEPGQIDEGLALTFNVNGFKLTVVEPVAVHPEASVTITA